MVQPLERAVTPSAGHPDPDVVLSKPPSHASTNLCAFCSGIAARIRVESVRSFLRNRCTLSAECAMIPVLEDSSRKIRSRTEQIGMPIATTIRCVALIRRHLPRQTKTRFHALNQTIGPCQATRPLATAHIKLHRLDKELRHHPLFMIQTIQTPTINGRGNGGVTIMLTK